MTADESVQSLGIYVNRRIGKSSMLEMHDHSYFEIFFLEKGEREYFIGDRFYKVKEAQIVLIPPGFLHRTIGGIAHRALLHIDEAYLSRYFSPEILRSLSCLGGVSVLHPAGEDATRLSALFQSLLACYDRQIAQGGQEALLAGYTFEILFLLSDKERIGEHEEHAPRRMEEIVRYIHENYATIHDIGQLADEFFISKYHLCQLFTKHLGLSIVSYMNMIRVRAACRALEAGERNITALALSLGFNSSAYFCKVFKEQMRQTPLEYQKSRRERGRK